MSAIQSENGYSAAVRLRLQVNGMMARIAQVGEGYLILRDQCEAPPQTMANVIICVDHDEIHYPVVLPEGILKGMDFVEFTDLENCKLVNATGQICSRTGPARVNGTSTPIQTGPVF